MKENDPVIKVRKKIIVDGLLLWIAFMIFLTGIFYGEGSYLQSVRVFSVLLICILMLWSILRTSAWKFTSHAIMITITIVVWSNFLFYSDTLNIITILLISIVISCGFYFLNSRWVIFYAGLNVLPVLTLLILQKNYTLDSLMSEQEISSTVLFAFTSFTFLFIAFTHYHFFGIFTYFMKESVQQKNELSMIVDELESSRQSIEQKTQIQKRIIAAITHDIKSPLKYLMLTAESLAKKDEQSDNDKEHQEIMNLIHSSTTHMYNITDNLLQYAKLYMFEDMNTISLFRLYDLVEEKIRLFEKISISRNTIIFNHVSNEIKVFSNNHYLSVIIHNILDNAIKHTNNGIINISASIEGDKFVISIEDNGYGMTTEQIEWCNIPREEKLNITNISTDRGLGLTMVKELISILKGFLKVESELNKGTKMQLIFDKEFILRT